MSELLVNTIKKADGTGGLTVPTTAGNIVTTGGATFTGAVTGTDLTLSGGVYLGGTGSDNYLDDYEEGTWTVAITGSTSGSSSIGTLGEARYIKIGRFVSIRLEATNISKNTLSGSIVIGNLPFAEPNIGNPTGNIRWGNISGPGSSTQIMPFIPKSGSTIELQGFDVNGYQGGVTDAHLSSSYNIYSIDIVYQVA